MIKSRKKEKLCAESDIRFRVWISAMVTNRSTLNKSSIFIHAAMHDGSHEW